MSNDTITRASVIATIGMMYERCDTADITDYRDLMLEAVKMLPVAETPQSWISCDERMPEESGTYIVSGKWESGKREVGECEYDTEDGYFNANWNFNIEAWRPEPEPWEGVR